MHFIEALEYINQIGDEVTLKRKHKYYGQVQLGMAILGLSSTKFILYSSCKKNYLNVNVDFDENFAKSLIKKISDNYFNNMLHFFCVNKI